jgi:hypothetical protein
MEPTVEQTTTKSQETVWVVYDAYNYNIIGVYASEEQTDEYYGKYFIVQTKILY